MKTTNLRGKSNIDTQKQNRKEEHLQEQQLILKLTEEQSSEIFSDKNLDRDNEIIKLLSGKEITLAEIKALKKSIAKTIQRYKLTYPQEYYKEMFRLLNLKLPKGKISQKPVIIARYTNEIIYKRFPKEILPMLQHLNPLHEFGFRRYKHFQLLTPEGYRMVQQYIRESIQTMKECSEWYEFRLRYARKYNLPYQLKLIESDPFMME